MVLKTQSMAKKVMIIVWKWSDDPDSGVGGAHWDEWKTSTEEDWDSLIRMDIQDKKDWRHIIQVAKSHQGKEVLLFLHNSKPNFLNEEARAEISKQLEQEEISFRSVLFSGGREPIYSAYCEQGILGLDGSFPGRWTQDGPDPDFSRPRHLISSKYFDFIWDFYYYGRRKRILELGEDFRIWSFGYNSVQDKPLLGFLKSKGPLWKKLTAFCGTYAAGEMPGEYDMRPYLTYLKAKGKDEAAEILAQTQERIAALLQAEPQKDKASGVMDDIYCSLTELFLALPENTI